MPIVTISRGSCSRANDVAEKVAQKLGFECISGDVLNEASEEYDVPEITLLRAVRDAPSVLDRFTFGKEKCAAYFQVALLEHFQRDNVVYHGLAGHYFVKGVTHVLKVRVIDNQDDRVKLVMEREKVFELAASSMEGLLPHGVTHPAGHRAMTKERALRVLEDSDEARRKWGLHLFGIDTTDPGLYDLVIRLTKLSVEDAAETICFVAGLDHFHATAESQRALDDMLLVARVKASLVERHPRVKVAATEGTVYITLEGARSSEEKSIRDAVAGIPGIKKIDVSLQPFATPD